MRYEGGWEKLGDLHAGKLYRFTRKPADSQTRRLTRKPADSRANPQIRPSFATKKPACGGWRLCRGVSSRVRRDVCLRFADGFQAAGTDIFLDFAVAFVECGALDIGPKDAACLLLGEAHVVPGHRSLAT